MSYSIKVINNALTKAAGLNSNIIAIYGSKTKPQNAVPASFFVNEPNKCLSRALLAMANAEDPPPVYVGGEGFKECCPFAPVWLGYRPMPPMVPAMLSSGTGTENGPKGFFIKDTPAICMESLSDIGTLTPIGNYMVAQTCSSLKDPIPDIRSILCFGTSEQIRTLCALVHFGTPKAFSPILGAWGSGCATFVAFPAGMSSNSPKESAFLSPMGPEAHGWFPENYLALGIPISIAVRMADGYPRSFAAQQADVRHGG